MAYEKWHDILLHQQELMRQNKPWWMRNTIFIILGVAFLILFIIWLILYLTRNRNRQQFEPNLSSDNTNTNNLLSKLENITNEIQQITSQVQTNAGDLYNFPTKSEFFNPIMKSEASKAIQYVNQKAIVPLNNMIQSIGSKLNTNQQQTANQIISKLNQELGTLGKIFEPIANEKIMAVANIVNK